MFSLIFFIVIALVVLIIKLSSPKDPFRYVWNLDLLEKKYFEFQQDDRWRVRDFYENARLRIPKGIIKDAWFFEGFFAEVEYVMRTRRSLDVLRKRAWEYAKELAKAYGYNEEEVANDDFFCPGWNELWVLYHKHNKRILSKNSFQETPRAKQYEHSEGSNRRSSDESTRDDRSGNQRSENRQTSSQGPKSKNKGIFQGIRDLKELKKKYYRLAKLNHPDQGGSEEAMKLLNQYYQEALEIILAKEGA